MSDGSPGAPAQRIRTSAFAGVPALERPSPSGVVELVKDLVLRGALRPGERLLSERALSEALGVSRPTVREAIRTLIGIHVLEARHGSGTYVASLEPADLLRPLRFMLALSHRGWEQLFEVWLVLEPAAARLAAERADLDQVERLRRCAGEVAEAVDDHARFAVLDVELHRLVVEATGNEILRGLHAGISAMLAESRAVTVELPGMVEQAVLEHGAIVSAIAAREPDVAFEAMQAHIRRVRDSAVSVRFGRNALEL